jgi:hypothetical protein
VGDARLIDNVVLEPRRPGETPTERENGLMQAQGAEGADA